MCGNGVRCVAEFLYTHGLPKDTLEIDTRAGRKTLRRLGEGLWQADMGRFSAMAADLPAVNVGEGPLVHVALSAAGKTWDAACVSMGNPPLRHPVAGRGGAHRQCAGGHRPGV